MAGAALVTGGAKRLGKAMVQELAELGYSVAIHYATSGDDAAALRQLLQDQGTQAVTLQANLLDDAECQGLVARAATALGQPLTVLINNASIFEYDNIQTASLESWDRHVGSNLKAPFLLTQSFAAQAPDVGCDENGEAISTSNIVNMIDQRIRKLTPEFMTYTIGKYGLWGLTQTAAQALAPRIRVNGIGPGPTLRGVAQSEAHFNAQRQATILERGASADDIRRTLRFILQSPAMTGQLICPDGGQHLAWKTVDVLGVE